MTHRSLPVQNHFSEIGVSVKTGITSFSTVCLKTMSNFFKESALSFDAYSQHCRKAICSERGVKYLIPGTITCCSLFSTALFCREKGSPSIIQSMSFVAMFCHKAMRWCFLR